MLCATPEIFFIKNLLKKIELMFLRCFLIDKSSWCKIKSRGGPFPIRGHRAVRVRVVLTNNSSNMLKLTG